VAVLARRSTARVVRRDVRARGRVERREGTGVEILTLVASNAAIHGCLAPRRAALGDVATRARTTASDRTHYRALF
jgi:hypothetical protein